jgi:hypothetical protein
MLSTSYCSGTPPQRTSCTMIAMTINMQQMKFRHACSAAVPLHPQVATSTPWCRLTPRHHSLTLSMPSVLQLHTRFSRHIVHNGKGFASSSTKPVGAAPAAVAAMLTADEA